MAEARQKSEWQRTAVACALLANCHSTKKRFTADDFNPYQEKQEKIWDQKMALEALRSFLPKQPKEKRHVVGNPE